MSPSREVNVIALLGVAWAHKRIVALTAAVCVALAMALALTATPIFRATVIVTLTHDPKYGGGGGLGSQIGGLASLAGFALPGNDEDREHQAILESRNAIQEFVKRDDVGAVMYPDPATRPKLWNIVEKFRRNVIDITDDKLKGITTITMDWPDPAVASRWANDYVATANNLIRARAIDVSTRGVDYLNAQLAKTNEIEVQRVMYNLIESETKTLMLANARKEYAFTIVDPAVTPEVRVSPRRTLITLSGLLVGLFLGAVLAIIYDQFQRARVRARS